MGKPFRFEGGRPLLEQLTAERLNYIKDLAEANQLNPGRGYRRIPHGSSGMSLDIEPGTAGSSAPPNFFQLLEASTTNESGVVTLKVKVTASDINFHEIVEQTFEVTETGKVWARVTSNDSYAETAWAIEHGASVPESSELVGYLPIGNYVVTDAGTLKVPTNLRFGPVGYLNATGGAHVWW